MKKNQLFTALADAHELKKNQVAALWDTLTELIVKELKKEGKSELPGLIKLVVRKVPARKACTKMVLGQMRDLAAKPASKKVRARVLKVLVTQVA